MLDYKNLSKVLSDNKISSKDLSIMLKELGFKVGKDTIDGYRKGSILNPKLSVLDAIADICKTNVIEFFENRKAIKEEIVKKEFKEHKSKYESLLPTGSLPSFLTKINLKNGYTGAGSFGTADEEEDIKELYIDINQIDKKFRNHNINGIKVFGDSMSPYIEHEDIVLYIEIPVNYPTLDGKYIINYNGNLQLKNISFEPNGDIVISSENKTYSDKIIYKDSQEMENFRRVGIVAGRILKG